MQVISTTNKPSPDIVLLWDIDGTVLSTDGAGVRAFDAAIKELGIQGGELAAIGDWKGRTDRWLAHAVIRHFGLDPEIDAPRLIESYLSALPLAFDQGPSALIEGAASLIKRVHNTPTIEQGLLTGNLRRGAAIKLGRFSLWDYFTFGAFADDGFDRLDLPPVAAQRIAERFGPELSGNRIIVIGDTEHDIACAKAIGARSLGIASYPGAHQRLSTAGADLIINDFQDTPTIWKWLTSPEW